MNPASVTWYRSSAVQTRVRLLTRLAQMSPAEIVHRLRKLLRKRLARRQASITLDSRSARALLTLPMRSSPAAYLCEGQTARGFVDIQERAAIVTRAKRDFSAAVRSDCSLADEILGDRLVLLSQQFSPARADFDWQADPEGGRLWPTDILDDADAVRGVNADVKLVWEVNRLQFLTVLARAYAYTEKEQYGNTCVDIARRWILSNPHPRGVNWASNLEVAVRGLSLTWTLDMLAGTPALTDDDARLWLASLRQHIEHLYANLSVYTDPTNHLIGEAAALAVLCIRFPEWDPSARLRERALSVLAKELARQVHSDGMSREQSTSYQRFVIDFCLQVIRIADRNGIALPATIRPTTRRMLDALAEFVGASGHAPQIGDSDGARGLPFFDGEFWDFRGVQEQGASVLKSSQGTAAATNNDAVLWLGGAFGSSDEFQGESAGAAKGPRSADIATAASSILPTGGYAFLRDPSDGGDSRLIFDCGPLGLAPHASHGHADLLSIIVDVSGREFLVDTGTYAYYDTQNRRAYFRSTRAHNTVEIGGRGQADPFDPFKWLNYTAAAITDHRLDETVSYVEAVHHGYRRLRSPVTHRRGVLGLAGGWIVIDWLKGRHVMAFTGISVERANESTVHLRTPSGELGLDVSDLALPGHEHTTSVHFETAPYSPNYGEIVDAPVIGFREEGRLPALRLTLLARAGRSGDGSLSVEIDPTSSGDHIACGLRDAIGRRFTLLIPAQSGIGKRRVEILP